MLHSNIESLKTRSFDILKHCFHLLLNQWTTSIVFRSSSTVHNQSNEPRHLMIVNTEWFIILNYLLILTTWINLIIFIVIAYKEIIRQKIWNWHNFCHCYGTYIFLTSTFNYCFSTTEELYITWRRTLVRASGTP